MPKPKLDAVLLTFVVVLIAVASLTMLGSVVRDLLHAITAGFAVAGG